MQALTKEDIDAVVGYTTGGETDVSDLQYADLLAVPCKGDNSSNYAETWLATSNGNYLWLVGENGKLACYANIVIGVRPVVSLKSSVKFTPASKKINNTTTWKISL